MTNLAHIAETAFLLLAVYLLGCVVGYVTVFVLIGFVILGVTLVWYIYRIAKGWLRLNEGQPVS